MGREISKPHEADLTSCTRKGIGCENTAHSPTGKSPVEPQFTAAEVLHTTAVIKAAWKRNTVERL